MQKNKEEILTEWKDKLNDASEQYMKIKNPGVFYNRLAYIYRGHDIQQSNVPEEVWADVSFQDEVMTDLFEKISELGVDMDARELESFIKHYPKAVEYVDLLRDDYEKVELLFRLAKKNPEIIDMLSKEKFQKISDVYAGKFEQLNPDLTRWHNEWYPGEEYEGSSSFVIQLLSMNPEILNLSSVQEMFKTDKKLECQVKLFQIKQKKAELNKEENKYEEQLMALEGERKGVEQSD